MSSDSTTEARWPLLSERGPFTTAGHGARRRRLPRSAWLLTGLAFLCGGLVSAAVFSIGWRHQAQRDTAARSALAAATARAHRLSTELAVARENATREREAAAQATASARATSRAAASLATEATASGRSAHTISSSAGAIDATTVRVTRELQALLTYLTTTPSDQIDSGYLATQASYLTRQLTALEDAGGNVAQAVTSFEAAMRKLTNGATALRR